MIRKNLFFTLMLIIFSSLMMSTMTLAKTTKHSKTANASQGKQSSAKAQKKVAGTSPKDLKKEMHFNDQVVNGKYQLPGESSIEIENEKPVFNLIQLRTDFKDRRANEQTRI